MNAEQRRAFYRRTLLSAWGLGTLALLFCVVMLMNELADRREAAEQAPAVSAAPSATAVRAPLEAKDIDLYFADRQGHRLVAERQRVELAGSQVAAIRTVLSRLIEGPRSQEAMPVAPPDTAVRGVYVIESGDRSGAELVLDFSRELEQGLPPGAASEGLLVYSVVQTLCQPGMYRTGEPVITRVRFLFEGNAQERFPYHVDLGNPVAPNPAWLAAQDASAAGNG